MIALNVNALNSLIKRYRMTEWMKKQAYLCCLQDSIQMKGHMQTQSDEKKMFHAKLNQKKAEVPVRISDKIDFKQNCH